MRAVLRSAQARTPATMHRAAGDTIRRDCAGMATFAGSSFRPHGNIFREMCRAVHTVLKTEQQVAPITPAL
jgi:hypothetical protein